MILMQQQIHAKKNRHRWPPTSTKRSDRREIDKSDSHHVHIDNRPRIDNTNKHSIVRSHRNNVAGLCRYSCCFAWCCCLLLFCCLFSGDLVDLRYMLVQVLTTLTPARFPKSSLSCEGQRRSLLWSIRHLSRYIAGSCFTQHTRQLYSICC